MTTSNPYIIPVIMCGGSGTRLWPASRESMPKQFIKVLGDLSTFQTTVRRVTASKVFLRPIVLASNDVRFIVAEQLVEIGCDADIVLEPIRRESAAAVAIAACHAAERHTEAVVMTLPADHVIGNDAAFFEASHAAATVARNGEIMALGVRPRHPATGYGYIKPGDYISGTDALRVQSFAEKPDATTAAQYIADGYLWNAGYLTFRPDVMLAELEMLAPAVLDAARKALALASTDLDFVRLDASALRQAPRISIDCAVMERTAKAGVLPVEFPWSDVGTWGTMWEAAQKDSSGNVLRGDVELISARNNFVLSEDVLTTVIGVDNVVVITQQDAVLVTSREQSDRVKDLVALLRAKKRPEADEHIRVYRPWGWYQRIDIGARFQVKRISVKPGGRLSLQKHYHRAEHWIVVKGTAEVTVGESVIVLHENESVQVPIGSVHRLVNPGKIGLEIIEVQVGSYTGEDDIVRIDDMYGR
ncbi:mannose-1-phosphate guanylyltransferase/mannose-6-phosphate isomerase [Microvirga calopogonii]|uniref:mannose-1-phosphate guanylyltransferase/mannose-6-phosphate isomerase n=1 Tax=Microvirga calopogonii TaxID=2078013 RepID=UPI00247AF50C|nr:mannose-1-phosphate guanylyltransferase/mannose-6-phosphate isomerase [Microvirga calopogonii]